MRFYEGPIQSLGRMRAVQVSSHGGPETLEVRDIDRPTPDDEELLVAVTAAGVNPVDTYFREGTYEPVGLPFTPGVDVAGEIIETGADVKQFAVGEMVYGTGIGNGAYQGAYAEYATIPTDRVVTLPEGVDPVVAGAAGVIGCTAWRALIDHGELRPAETSLIHGGAGGVGHMAVQLGAAVNADVLTTAAPDYHEQLTELGAQTVFDYTREDLQAAIDDRADGVDVIVDHRLDDYLQLDAEVAAPHGRVIGIGENSPDPGFTNDGPARSKDVTYQFMSLFNTPDLRVPLRRLATLLDKGVVSVEIADTYTLAEAPAAHRDVMNRSYLGKLVIKP